MEGTDYDMDDLFEQCRDAVKGPYSSFSAPPIIVTDQLHADGLSLPAIATSLRRWAIARHDVLKVVLSYGGKTYTIAVLLADSAIPVVKQTTQELRKLSLPTDGRRIDLCILGTEHAEALLFHEYGTYAIHQRMNDEQQNAAA